MGEMIRKQSVSPIMLDGKVAGSEALLQNIHTFMKKSLSKQASTERTMKQNTKQLAEITESVEEIKQQAKEEIRSYVAKKIIRDQLQQERRNKAAEFVEGKVQLTIDSICGTADDVDKAFQKVKKEETTKVAKQITAYIKVKLGLKSIDDISNGLVEKHKQLLKELTWKQLDTFMKKGSR